MNKKITKLLVTGASALMLTSIGISFNNVHASNASAFNHLTALMSKDHAHEFSTGVDGAYTIVHNGKRIIVTMTHASINGRRVSYQKALKALRAKKHHAKRIRYRKYRKNRNHKRYRYHKHARKYHHYRRHY